MPTPFGWQTQAIRKTLIGEKCEGCGKIIFPPRDYCPECKAPGIPNLNAKIREGKITVFSARRKEGQ